MSRLRELQHELGQWKKRNFPTSGANEQLLGMVEELGELSHAFLKAKQGIRGTPREHRDAIIDAVGDLFIYGMNFCNEANIDLESALEETAALVMRRDWIQFPKNGVSE